MAVPGDEKTKKTKKTLEGVKVKAETTTPASEDLAKKPDDELQGLSSKLGVDLLKEKDIDKILKLFQSGELKLDTLLKDSFKYIKKIDFKSLNINSEATNFNDAFNYFFEKFTGKNVLEKMAFLYATQYLMKEMKDFPSDKSSVKSYEFKLKGGKFEIVINKKDGDSTKLLDQEFNKETLGKIDNDVTFLKANGSKLPIADVLKPHFQDNKTKKSTEKPKETDKTEKDEKIPDNKHGQMYLSLKKQMEENPQLKRNAFAKLALVLFKLLSYVTSWKDGMKPGIFKTKLKEEHANKNDAGKLKNFLSSENISPGPLEDLKKLNQERASTKYVASKIMKLGEIRDPVVLASKLLHSSYEVKGEKDSCYTQTDLDSLEEDGLKFGTVLILAPIIPSFYKKTAHTVAYVAKDKSIRYYSVKDNKEVTITGGLKEMATKFRVADAYVPNPNFLNNLGQVQATVSATTNEKPATKTGNDKKAAEKPKDKVPTGKERKAKMSAYGIESNKGIKVDSELSFADAVTKNLPKVNGKECPPETLENLTLLEVYYYSFDKKIHKGQIVIHKKLASDIEEVFALAYKKKFPMASVIPISQFDWKDEKSMQKNNTSCFCYRNIGGTKKLSNHAKGFAIDINPKLNPHVKKDGSKSPSGSEYDPKKEGTLTADHFIVKKFKELGWKWGEEFDNPDYQHFEKKIV